MQGHVDYRSGIVRVADLSWPFDLDLHAGAASMVIQNQQFAVRPLLWREKVALARFAHLGLAFVHRQFLRLSLAGAAPPADEPGLAALGALALWVNAPDESQPGLPLDPVLLGAVALNICRAARLRPADLDERAAAEVELLWQAVARSDPTLAANRPADDDAGQVRILVLPDPPMEPTDAAHSAQMTLGHSASLETSSAAILSDGSAQEAARWFGQAASPNTEAKATLSSEQASRLRSEPSEEAQDQPIAPPASTASASPTIPVLPVMPERRQPGQHELSAPIASAPFQPRSGTAGGKPVRRSGLAGAFRVTYPEANSPTATATVVGGSVEENDSGAQPAVQQAPARISLPGSGASATPAFVSIAARPTLPGSASPFVVHPDGPTAAETKLGKAMLVDVNETANSLSPANEDRQEARPAIEWGSLIDELNERLERAAADLGIDMEE